FTPRERAASCAALDSGSAIGLAGLTSTATTAASGSNSRSMSSFVATKSAENPTTPVRLPPGRLRLVAKPNCTGSTPMWKTIGMVAVAALAASVAGVPTLTIAGDPAVDEIDRQRRQAVVLAVCKAIFDRHVLTFDVAG